MYLLDTNVTSELRRPSPHAAVLEWTTGVPAERLFVSAVTVGEIHAGIEIIREQDKANAELQGGCLERTLLSYSVRSMGAEGFRECAWLMHGRSHAIAEDAMITATATANRLTVVTRNVKDFGQLGVPLQNPFN